MSQLGILFFLFEFFGDQSLAFAVLNSVWFCELFSCIAARTAISLRIFPLTFIVYFTAFHCYFLACPFGYQVLAFSAGTARIPSFSPWRHEHQVAHGHCKPRLLPLTPRPILVTCPPPYLFVAAFASVFTVAFYLWTKYELPALASGRIGPARMREWAPAPRQLSPPRRRAAPLRWRPRHGSSASERHSTWTGTCCCHDEKLIEIRIGMV